MKVIAGKEVISKDSGDFYVYIEGIKDPGINRITVWPGDLWFLIEQKDGWTVHIGRSMYDRESLIVTRFKKPKSGESYTVEYLTKEGKWVPGPTPPFGSPPADVFKIPVLTVENSPN